jgi:hypothetical protein
MSATANEARREVADARAWAQMEALSPMHDIRPLRSNRGGFRDSLRPGRHR